MTPNIFYTVMTTGKHPVYNIPEDAGVPPRLPKLDALYAVVRDAFSKYVIEPMPKKRIDFFSKLPLEISLEIFSYLHVSDLLSLQCVNKNVNRIVKIRLTNIVKLYKKYIPELNFQGDNISFSDYYSEFRRLCIDYEIPAALQLNIPFVGEKIKLKKDMALCKFARKFIGGDLVQRSNGAGVEAEGWRRFLHDYPVSIIQLPMTQDNNTTELPLPEHLPPEIGDLTTLQTLIIDYPLKSLPSEISKLENLKSLHLIKTQLKTLPPGFQNLNLEKLYIQNLNLCKNSQKIMTLLQKKSNLDIIEVIPRTELVYNRCISYSLSLICEFFNIIHY